MSTILPRQVKMNDIMSFVNGNFPIFDSDFAFMQDYVKSYQDIDTSIMLLYGERVISLYLPENYTGQDLYNSFNKLFNGYLSINEYNINRIYEALHIDYKPLDNYDKESTITLKMDGQEIDTLDKQGDEVTTKNDKAHTDISTDSVSPEINNGLYNESQSKTEYGEKVYTDTISYNNRTDVNTKSFNSRVNTTTEKTRGNIGTTTSMEMLTSEFQGRFEMDFYLYIFRDFILKWTW